MVDVNTNRLTAETEVFPEVASIDTPPVGKIALANKAGVMTIKTHDETETALGGGSALPAIDTTAIVKGSVDATKLARFEVDGLTTGTTRVMTVPDFDISLTGGAASATDNAFARFDGTTGKLLQNSAATLDDNGGATFPSKLRVTGSADEVQFILKANGTQTQTMFTVVDSSNVVQTSMDASGGWGVNLADNAAGDFRVNGAGDLIFYTDASNNNAGFGTSTPDASAKVDIVSTTKGFGLPTMTTSERNAISSPRDGLVVYNTTTDTKDFRANGQWLQLSQYMADGIIFTDPTLQTWTNLNQSGTFTEDTTNRRMTIFADGNATLQVRGWHCAAPTPPYEIRIYASSWFNYTSSNDGLSLGFRQSSDGKLACITQRSSGTDLDLSAFNWNTATSFNAAPVTPFVIRQVPNWWKLIDDNTNRIMQWSMDGLNWHTLYSVARTTFLTADQIFIGVVLSTASTYDVSANILSYEEL